MPRKYKRRRAKSKSAGLAKWRVERMPSNESLDRILDRAFLKTRAK